MYKQVLYTSFTVYIWNSKVSTGIINCKVMWDQGDWIVHVYFIGCKDVGTWEDYCHLFVWFRAGKQYALISSLASAISVISEHIVK